MVDLQIRSAGDEEYLSESEEDDPGGMVLREGAEDSASIKVLETGCDQCTREVSWDEEMIEIPGETSPITLDEDAGTVTYTIYATENMIPDEPSEEEVESAAVAAPSTADESPTSTIRLSVSNPNQDFGSDQVTAWAPVILIKPEKTTVKRDEIINVTISVIKSFVGDLTLNLNITPNAMRSEVLGARGNVQMYDFGTEDGGTVTPNVTQITLKQSEGYENTIKAVFNKEGTLKITAGSLLQLVFGQSDPITVEKRIRQYSTKEDNDDTQVNDFDALFEGANGLWADWGWGPAGGNYGLNKLAFSPELLKAIAYIESNINPTKSGINGDIMQIGPGGGGTVMSAGGKDWNWNATPVKTVKLIPDPANPGNFRYSPTGTPTPVYKAFIADGDDNLAYPTMGYALHRPPGAVVVSSPADSIKWAMRQLYFKHSNIQGNEHFADDETGHTFILIPATTLSEQDSVRRAGDGTQPYVDRVYALYQIGTKGAGGLKIWPILTNMHSRK